MRLRVALGDVIRDERLKKGLTLRDVSVRGTVALGYLSEVERGRKEASSEILDQIALALRVPVSDLVVEAGRRMAEDDLEVLLRSEALELLAREEDLRPPASTGRVVSRV